MTDREKAIVMAHTGICMLTGDKFQIFHKYVEDIMGRPIWTHEMGLLADEIKEMSEADFMALCADESSSENPNKWIPVSERLPEDGRPVLIYAWSVHHVIARYDSFRFENGYKKCWVTADAWNGNTEIEHEVIAWMPLTEPTIRKS